MPRFELWRFRFRDPGSGRWIRTRYRATLADLDQRHGEGRYQTFGLPEVRDVDADAGYAHFNPARPNVALNVNVCPVIAIARRPSGRHLTIAGIAQ